MINTSEPYTLAFIGGLLIGLATTIHLFLKGRITGMSGIFNGIIDPIDRSDFIWRTSFVSGLVFTSCIAYRQYGFNKVPEASYLFDSPNTFAAGSSTISLILAGLFVGLGTRMGNGCTSGHGVCGLPRLSRRSFVAVMTFMTTGILTATFKPNFMPHHQGTLEMNDNIDLTVNVALALSVLMIVVNFVRNKGGSEGVTDILVSFVVGSIFAVGLMISGMSRKSKVLGFLTLNKDWDMSLMFVMGGAVLLNLITFHYIYRIRGRTLGGRSLGEPSRVIDLKLIVGAALFGIGWGLGGICPGPAMLVTPIYFSSMAKFMISMAAGQYLFKPINSVTKKLKIN